MLRDSLGLTDVGAKNFRRGVFFCTLANLVLMAPIGILFLLVSDFMDHLVAGAPLPALAPYLAGCVGILALMVLTQWAEYANTYHKVYEESARKRTDLAEHLRRLPLSFFGRRDLSDLTNAIMKDCSDQERMFMHVMPQLFGTGLSTAIVIVGIFFYDWRLALAAFWVVPAALLVMALTGKHQQRKAQAMEDARLEVADGVQEFLECAQEIRATNRSAAHLDALAAKLDAFERRQVASELTTGVFVTSAQAFLKLGIGTTVFVGATLLVSGQTDFMTYFAFLLVVTRVYDPVNLILQSIGELLSMRLSIRRTQELAAEKPMEGSTDFAPRGHDVVFEDVSFSYGDGEQVLRDVSFTAREGEVTALVGPSGSGKSTVAKLAARFWDADAGSVRVGGVNVADVDPETLLADYAEVFQDVVLFDDTVMGNIRLGRAGATDEEVLAAARAAMCDEFVSRMPQGYDTVIGENGGRLSGGERQRISIARAILKDAPVVLLDEATASLDVENETQVQRALSRLLAGKTVLVIAHRMRTVANADKIVVLKEGRVAEQGAPAELMAREGGLYRRMVELQTEASGWSLAS
ncbi:MULTISPECIES: ABC transporter ATP-binding protein [Eggerthella]|jgi:ATP-binding cassette, subfamily B, bacterial IrtB/YbtQ|uniref:ABC transporter ATP-binding protein n=3 Tax=Eggerthella TaxID=84111 RepID=A0A369MM56_EGGLN|nr:MULTISPECIES: ABC transporter ATP-binding protein [Eggerthella]EGC89340.1 ABC transporter, ATP-binding protein [Eggerthella sp. HGA1]MBU5398195.1 ABC transporter ATP-binding protein/permease [Eggerthella lenta]MCB6525097.1 ABC transporter ATP-binding protein/permease [Eggerthella lenta]MCB6940465.1 ABC transporter ATP-binding protein/permease [Eggerthella lenta]MCG4875077.1 ABC transporter ATP-binding protein/permease [Eggerthella lenta]